MIPIVPALDEYANEVRDKLHAAGFCADSDTDSGNTLNKKVRNAQLAQYNFILGKMTSSYQSSCLNMKKKMLGSV